jgi:8-oxo-dGTP diphosphatase
MVRFTREQQIEYEERLPKKRISAGVMLWNGNNELLLVKPNYRDRWNLPGGVVDEGEAPKQGAIREVEEELGILINKSDLHLKVVDYKPPQDIHIEIVYFVFDGGELDKQVIDAIRIQEAELDDYRFVPVKELGDFGSEWLVRRTEFVRNSKGNVVYLEGGYLA